jgi:hypothetical protein
MVKDGAPPILWMEQSQRQVEFTSFFMVLLVLGTSGLDWNVHYHRSSYCSMGLPLAEGSGFLSLHSHVSQHHIKKPV